MKDEPQLKKQHPVPQNIMSVEFKLVGDMTIRQFFYVAAGAVIAFLLYKTQLPFLIKWTLVPLIGLGGLGMAFVPLQDRGLDVWLKSFVKSLTTATQMVWKKDPQPPSYFLADYASSIQANVLALTPTKSRAKLYEYLESLKKSQEPDSFEKIERNFLNSLNYSINIPEKLTFLISNKPKGQMETKNDLTTTIVDRPLKHLNFEDEIELPKELFKRTDLAVDETNYRKNSKIDNTKKKFKVRKIKDLNKQVKDLEKTIELIRKKEGKNQSFLEKPKPKTNLQKEEEKDKPQKKKRNISNEIKSMVTDIRASINNTVKKKDGEILVESEIKEEKLPQPEIKKERPKVEISKPKVEISNITIKEAEVEKTKDKGKVFKNNPTLANIVLGRVADKEGHVLDESIIIIKDSNDEPERAVKTNSLGEFKLSTPLPNGNYKIEVKHKSKTFDMINFEARGEKIEPLTIISKD